MDTRQDPHLVDGVLLVLVAHFSKLDLLKCIYLLVLDPPHFEDTGVSTIAKFLYDLEIFQLTLGLLHHWKVLVEFLVFRYGLHALLVLLLDCVA